MKKLSIQVTFLIIFGLVSILVMEFVFGDKQSEMAFQRKCFEDKKTEIETLVVGHCEGHSNINPFFFSKKTFNFSHFDQGAYYTEKMVEKYIGANTPKLANIVINVNPFSFSARHVPSSLFLKESFMHLDIFPDLYRDGFKLLSGFTLYYQELENLLGRRFVNLDLKNEILSKENFTEKDIDKKSEKPIAYCNGFKGYFGSYPTEKVNDFYKEFIEYFDFKNPEHHHYRKIAQQLSGGGL